MKITAAILPLALALNQASAFAPSPLRAHQLSLSSASQLRMTDDFADEEPPEEEVVEAAAPVVEEPAPVVEEPAAVVEESTPAGSLVTINQENIEFTAGILGAIVGLYIGGPYLAAIAAAAANLASKSEGNVVGTISSKGIEAFNYLVGFNAQYSVLDKAGSAVGGAVDKLKASDSIDPESIEQVEDALAKAKATVIEVNDEYDLVGAAKTALVLCGDLVEKTAETAVDLNKEYGLTSKAKDALDAGISKAGVSDSLDQATAFLDEKKAQLSDTLSDAGIEIGDSEKTE